MRKSRPLLHPHQSEVWNMELVNPPAWVDVYQPGLCPYHLWTPGQDGPAVAPRRHLPLTVLVLKTVTAMGKVLAVVDVAVVALGTTIKPARMLAEIALSVINWTLMRTQQLCQNRPLPLQLPQQLSPHCALRLKLKFQMLIVPQCPDRTLSAPPADLLAINQAVRAAWEVLEDCLSCCPVCQRFGPRTTKVLSQLVGSYSLALMGASVYGLGLVLWSQQPFSAPPLVVILGSETTQKLENTNPCSSSLSCHSQDDIHTSKWMAITMTDVHTTCVEKARISRFSFKPWY